MSHRTALPATFASACALLVAAGVGAHASAPRIGQEPSPAFEAFRQMERDLINGIEPQPQYRSNGYPGFGLRVYETN